MTNANIKLVILANVHSPPPTNLIWWWMCTRRELLFKPKTGGSAHPDICLHLVYICMYLLAPS